MSEINPMDRIEPVIYGVLKIRWRDGYVGLADLRPVIEQGDLFSFLRAAPERFDQARLDEHGHRIVWIDDEGDEIDLGSDSLRSAHRGNRNCFGLRANQHGKTPCPTT